MSTTPRTDRIMNNITVAISADTREQSIAHKEEAKREIEQLETELAEAKADAEDQAKWASAYLARAEKAEAEVDRQSQVNAEVVGEASRQVAVSDGLFREARAEVGRLKAEFEKMTLLAAQTADRNVELRRRSEKAEDELSREKSRLDWLEVEINRSYTGVSFDYTKYVENGIVIEKGYRFMRHHFLGARYDTLRAVIDSAILTFDHNGENIK